MKDINYPLRKAYYSALSGMTDINDVTIPVYYGMAPEDNINNNYITFSKVSNTDASTKSENSLEVAMNVTINTFDNNGNSGQNCDFIANKILQAIYPDTYNNLDLSDDGLQLVNTRLETDIVNDYAMTGSRVYLDRTIIFSHLIFIQ